MSASSADVVFQDAVYIGINMENILYGLQLFLYFKTLHTLLKHRKKQMRRKSDIFYALFSTMMLFLITVWISTQSIFGEKMWISDPDYPGGPVAYWNNNISAWYMDFGTTAVITLQLMTDALMIYRCQIIWDSYRAIIIPCILWVATLALGIMVDWTSSVPGGNFFSGLASIMGLSYYTTSVFLTTTVTAMICYRMARHGRAVKSCLGNEYASQYFAVVSVVVESVLPYTLSGIAFVISLGVGSQTSVAFACIYISLMCISPQMLILRVVVGRAWQKDSGRRLNSTLQFTPERTSQFGESVGGGIHIQTLTKGHLQDQGDSVVGAKYPNGIV